MFHSDRRRQCALRAEGSASRRRERFAPKGALCSEQEKPLPSLPSDKNKGFRRSLREPGRSLREAVAASKSSLSRAAIGGNNAPFGSNTKGAPKGTKGALFFVRSLRRNRDFCPAASRRVLRGESHARTRLPLLPLRP